MKRYLAIDAGGTKVAAVLYDEEFRQKASVISGSLRENTTSRDLIEKHIDQVIAGLGLDGGAIEEISGTCEGSLIERIKTICEVKSVRMMGELELGLCAAGIFGDGMLSLSGTGATLFYKYNGKSDGTGGYGASVSDEGSGYWIARNAFIAAIRDDEERGPKTVLTDMIPQHLGFKDRSELRTAIFSIYGHKHHSPVACVARCTPLVTAAAEQGDEVAAGILREAGVLLAQQQLYLVRKHHLPDDLPLTISGSVWRGNTIMFDTFSAMMREQSPSRPIIIPRLEPIMGAVARRWHETHGRLSGADIDSLRENFPDYRYDLTKMNTHR